MKAPTKLFYEFGEFRLDIEKHRLLRSREIVSITPKAVETLAVLLQRPGVLVERDELMNSVWRDATVEPGNLDVTISMLRKALGENSNGRKFIETVPRLGYKFVADVREVLEEVPALVVEKQTVARLTIDEEVGLSRKASRLVSRLLTTSRHLAILTAVAAVIALEAGFLAYFRPWNSNPPSAAVPNIKSIAVLPFKTIGSDKENAHQGLGMADILITRLSNLRTINVRPTSAVMSFENGDEDSISIGRKLKIDGVLEGTIYRTGDKVRVTGRFIRVSDQSTIWSGQFERLLKDELQVQNEIALQVVDALALTVSSNEKSALTKRYTESADAYQLYIKGRYHWNKRNYEGLAEAERLFRNAIDKDPNFALAYVGLADTTAFSYRQAEMYPALTKALELDPNLAEAYATQGFALALHQWKWKEAEDSFRRSIELNPGYATAHQWYATLLGIEGRPDEADAEMRRAMEINPLSYNFLADLGQVYYLAHQYDKAKEYCEKALEIYPDFVFAHTYLFQVYLQTGEYEAAIEQTLKGDLAFYDAANPPAEQEKGKLFAEGVSAYRQGGIRKYLEYRLRNLSKYAHNLNGAYWIAWSHAFLGDKEKALDNLEKGLEVRAFWMAWVKADPVFDSLHLEPRYQAILKKMGLVNFKSGFR
ncbi:MAG: tetratricopeptide repeat protein [bacterium]